jgi:hypothetical protein
MLKLPDFKEQTKRVQSSGQLTAYSALLDLVFYCKKTPTLLYTWPSLIGRYAGISLLVNVRLSKVSFKPFFWLD